MSLSMLIPLRGDEKHRGRYPPPTPVAFKGEFTFGERPHKSINVVAGTLADGKIEWETSEVTQGGANQPTTGRLKGDSIDATFKMVIRNGNKKPTQTGAIKLTNSE